MFTHRRLPIESFDWNDGDTVLEEGGEGPQLTRRPSAIPPLACEWKPPLAERCKTSLAFSAKILALGLFLFVGTALVGNLVVAVGDEVEGETNNTNKSSHQPLTLSLPLDEATYQRLREEILKKEKHEAQDLELRWPPNPDNPDCPHCGQIDDDDNTFFSKSDLGESWWALRLHNYRSHKDAAAAKADGHRFLSGEERNGSTYFEMRGEAMRTQILEAVEAAREIQEAVTEPENGEETDQSGDVPWFVSAIWIQISEALDLIKNISPHHFASTDVPRDWRWTRHGQPPSQSEQERVANTMFQGGNVRRRSLLSAHSSTTAISDVNSGLLRKREAELLSDLEDTLCDEIERAFPRAFSEVAKRNCRLKFADAALPDFADVDDDDLDSTLVLLVGDDRDEHGCIASAGYSWCQALNRCHRPWETVCEDDDGREVSDGTESGVDNGTRNAVDNTIIMAEMMLGNDRDEHGCDRSAGYSWCELSKSCHRTWESACNDGNDEQVVVKAA
jgi:hypothetical protein